MIRAKKMTKKLTQRSAFILLSFTLRIGAEDYAILPERRILACAVDGAGGEVLVDLLCSLSRHHPPVSPVDKNRHPVGLTYLEAGCERTTLQPSRQGLYSYEDIETIITSNQCI